MLDAIVAGAEAPEEVSELRGQRRIDAGELGGQFVALGPRGLVSCATAIILESSTGTNTRSKVRFVKLSGCALPTAFR